MQVNEASIPPADTTREILHRLFGAQPRGFAVRLWNGTLGPEGVADADVVVALTHAGALRRMLGYPLDLALGESFIRGDFDVPRSWTCIRRCWPNPTSGGGAPCRSAGWTSTRSGNSNRGTAKSRTAGCCPTCERGGWEMRWQEVSTAAAATVALTWC